jgi:hypothetical protein
MIGKRKYSFRQVLKNIPKDKAKEYLHTNVFDTAEFNIHVQRVAFNLKLDERIVRDVLVSYFTNIMLLINSKRKLKTKINVYGFFSLIVEKGNRL